jgi:hypothetical protein
MTGGARAAVVAAQDAVTLSMTLKRADSGDFEHELAPQSDGC